MRKAYILLPMLALLASCRQVVGVVNMKQMAPEIAQYGLQQDAWYEYMPQYAPHYCLKTTCSLAWHDPDMQLGHWLLRHPLPPYRVMLEARGDTLYIHRGFVWDGVSFGNTAPEELVPSLLHDALYYAQQGGAPIPRRVADKVYLRAARKYGCSSPLVDYLVVRALGGFFGKPVDATPPQVELRTPEAPVAPPPEGVFLFNALQR